MFVSLYIITIIRQQMLKLLSHQRLITVMLRQLRTGCFHSPTASQYSTTLYGNFYCATLVSETAARCTGCHRRSVSLAICRTRFAKRMGSRSVTLVGLFSGTAFWLSFNKFRKSRCCVLNYSCQQQGVVK